MLEEQVTLPFSGSLRLSQDTIVEHSSRSYDTSYTSTCSYM